MPLHAATGSIVEKSSGVYYQIGNAQDIPPFFINLATASDIWMFLSSNGALTAGRQNAEGALFPYETDDRLHLAASTGPKTIIRLNDGRIWEPLNAGYDNPFNIRRNIFKRLTGDAVLFEEINDTLGLTFTYEWEAGERFGIVRTARLANHGGQSVSLAVLDGLLNIIPHGISKGLADSSSCLTDAYKACERPDRGSLAVYSLTSTIVDTPEPVEMLRANVAWRIGNASAYLLSARQVPAFCSGDVPEDERRSVGRKGAYLTYQQIELAPVAEESWIIIMDARLTQRDAARLIKKLNGQSPEELRREVEEDIRRGTLELTRIVAAADGLQCTADKRASARHYMNVLYNNMRGGVFMDNYAYEPALLEAFAKKRNKELAERRADFFEKLRSGESNIPRLHKLAYEDGDPDLIRVCLEFLPLTFSRRHGDPSRPWNRFHIRVKDDNGNRIYHYEGNWRDIFQNWEAMSLSFPAYIEPIIAKFLNASTADGFNPYRISEDGIDWEAPEPDNPFSGYGYWGDHQIVYLNKLLEWLLAFSPEGLKRLAGPEIFTYADVPYEIKPYSSLIKDGKDTIAFNYDRHKRIMARAEAFGTDGKLLFSDNGRLYRVSILEKLLVPVLAKLSNLVPGGGIWMNTQRPEWNDANNAIVGNGLSMVTVYQLYRHLLFMAKLARIMDAAETTLSVEVKEWMENIQELLAGIADKTPREFLDEAGIAFERYRSMVYAGGFSGKENVSWKTAASFIYAAVSALVKTIEANKRDDGLYNAYNILTLTENSLEVSPLFPMLEGQTAVLGSGRLGAKKTMELVAAMESGGLYGDEHKTFYLYPVKRLKTFMERNIIPEDSAGRCGLIGRLLGDGNEGLVLRDDDGHIRFHDGIRQSSDLESTLDRLMKDPRYGADAKAGADGVREIYEEVFAHRQFTGRSGIMYKYEGIGSIYWHQNSKFLLSFQEAFSHARGLSEALTAEDLQLLRETHSQSKSGGDLEETSDCLPVLKKTYYRLRAGLGFNKEPSLWGAFPLEPYSHTPMGMPAQQPGMTGQVKEDILTRYAELGITATDGVLSFVPALLDRSEFLTRPETFRYFSTDGQPRELSLEKNSLAFTFCQVPVVYRLGAESSVTVFYENGSREHLAGTLSLGENHSRSLFARDGAIRRIEVELPEEIL